MAFALYVKRAMRDVLPSYKGELDNNWGDLDSTAYYLFCNRNGGYYTSFPTRHGQSESFLDLVDRYENPEYTKAVVEESAPKRTGNNLRDFTPDRQPIPEDKSPEERKKISSVVNENVGVKLTPSVPDPAKELEREPANEEPTKDQNNADESRNEPAASNTDGSLREEAETNVVGDNEENTDRAGPELKDASRSNAQGEQGDSKAANSEGEEKPKASENVKHKPGTGKLPSVGKIKLR